MGTVLWIACPQHMSVGIGSGTDCLGFQCFQRIGGRHLAGHHAVEIFLQGQFIHHCDSLWCPQQLYLPSVGRGTLIPVHIAQFDPAGQHRWHHTDPFSYKIITVHIDSDYFSLREYFLLQFSFLSILQHKITVRRQCHFAM